MTDNSIDKTTEQAGVPFDDKEAARMLGLSAAQKKLADGILRGQSQTAAAKEAGYAGTGSTLRSNASSAANAAKVRSDRAWARFGGGGTPEVPADNEELRKILSRRARTGDPTQSNRAIEILHRINQAEAEANQGAVKPRDPLDILEAVAALGPVGCALAFEAARSQKVLWKPKNARVPTYEEYCAMLEPALRDDARKANTEINGVVATPAAIAKLTKKPPQKRPNVPLSSAAFFGSDKISESNNPTTEELNGASTTPASGDDAVCRPAASLPQSGIRPPSIPAAAGPHSINGASPRAHDDAPAKPSVGAPAGRGFDPYEKGRR